MVIVIVMEVLKWLNLVLMGGSFLFGVWLLVKQYLLINDFSYHSFVREHVRYYQNKAIQDPAYIEKDIRNDIGKELDPDIGWMNLIIGYLSIFGLLGTFIGLTIALPKIIGLDISGSDNSEVTRALYFAFGTSMAGLFFSAFLSVLQRFHHNKIDEHIKDAKSVVFKNIFEQSRDEIFDINSLAQNIDNSFKEGIKELSEIQKVSISDFKDWSADLIKTSSQQIFEMVNSNEERLESVIKKLEQERKSIDSVKKNWNKAIDQLHKSSLNLKSMTQNLDNFAALTEKLIDQVEGFGETFAVQIALIDNFRKEQSQPSELINQMNMYLAESLTQNQKSIDASSANQALVEKTVEKVVTSFTSLLDNMEKMMDGINNSFESQMDAVKKFYTEGNEEMRNFLLDANRKTAEGHEKQIDALASMSKDSNIELKGILTDTNTKMMESFAMQVESISKNILAMNTELFENMKELSSAIHKSFPKSEQQLVQLNQNISQLDRKLKRAFETIINYGVRRR